MSEASRNNSASLTEDTFLPFCSIIVVCMTASATAFPVQINAINGSPSMNRETLMRDSSESVLSFCGRSPLRVWC